MKVLFLDPSTTATGWAIMDGPMHLIEAGLLTPYKSALASVDRAWSMGSCVRKLMESRLRDSACPIGVVVEMPSAHLSAKGKRRGAHGLGVYAAGAGIIYAMTREASYAFGHCSFVFTVGEQEWTRKIAKEDRALATRAMFPELANVSDPGMDAADAVGLGHWWWTEQLLRESVTKAGGKR